MFPQNSINSDKKDDAWVREQAKSIMSIASSDFIDEKNDDITCWDIYHGKADTKKYKYLSEVEGFTYPAKFRNIGNQIVRSKINLLESKQQRRTFRFKAIAMDERSLQEKHLNKIKAYLTAVKTMYEERDALLSSQMQQVNDKLNDLQQQVQVQPENEEMAAQLEQLKANLPLIQLEYGKIIRALSREKLNENEMQEKIDKFLLNTDQEIMQQVANASLKSAIQTEDLYDHWNIGLKEKIVTGKPCYVTYYDERREDIIFRQIDSYQCFYSRGGNNKWSNYGEFGGFKESMDYQQICSEFNLTDTENTLLKAYTVGGGDIIKNYVGNSAYFDASENLYKKHDKIEVWRIWFNTPREVYYKESPNKHSESDTFYNLIEKDTKIKKDEVRKKGLIYDQYSCVVIGNVICINNGIQTNVFRPKDIPGLPALPLITRTFNSMSEKPYSSILRTKDLIELYDIINYKKELTIALSGVKGMIMDKSQKPESMTTGKWMYYRRLGTMWIETMKKGRKVPATFNQFTTFDDGISESIQWFDYMLNGIEALISKVLGITPSSEGQFVSKDPVQNVKMSNEQSALITEIQFSENDKVFGKAIEQYLNLKCQFVWSKGKVINSLNEDLEEVLIQIPKGFLNNADFRMYTTNNIKEDTIVEEIRQIALQSWSRSELPISALVSIYKVEDVNEMEKQLISLSKKAEEMRSQNANAINENKGAVDQRTNELKGQIDMQIEQVRNEVISAKLELEKAQFAFDQQKFNWESQYKERELQAKTQLDSMKIGSENEIESAYLQEEGRANRVDEMIRTFEAKVNALINEMNIKAGNIQSIRKTEVDKQKNMRNKENIKD